MWSISVRSMTTLERFSYISHPELQPIFKEEIFQLSSSSPVTVVCWAGTSYMMCSLVGTGNLNFFFSKTAFDQGCLNVAHKFQNLDRSCVRCSSVWESLLADLWPHCCHNESENHGYRESCVVCKIGPVATKLPGTWSSLETKIMLLVSKDTLQRRRCL